MKKLSLAAATSALLVVVAPQMGGGQHLALQVSPVVALEPAFLTIARPSNHTTTIAGSLWSWTPRLSTSSDSA